MYIRARACVYVINHHVVSTQLWAVLLAHGDHW